MKKQKKLFGLILFCAINLVAKVGFSQKALPDVKLKNLKGEAVDVASFTQKGTPVILSFWATWCSPCKKELANMAELYEDWKKQYGVEIVAISIDDARNMARLKSYVAGVDWPFQVLHDPNEDMKRHLNFQTVPFTLLLNKSGEIVYRHNSYLEGDEYVLEDKLKQLTEKK